MLCFVGTILGPSVLFIHFLEHLFLPIMGRSEEPNIGLPILRSELFLLGYILLQMTRRKKWDLENMKATNEVVRNKEMGS